MRFKLAMCAVLAALALGPPVQASQGYETMKNDDLVLCQNDAGLVGALPVAATFNQEVMLSGDSRAVGEVTDWAPSALNQATIYADTGQVSFSDMNAIYDLRAIDRAGTFQGHVILKTSQQVPVSFAGDMNGHWIERFDNDDLSDANKGAPALRKT